MSDFLCFSLASAFVYIFSLAGIEYAISKSKKVQRFLISLIAVVFSLCNGLAMSINQQKIPIGAVEKSWNEYANYCREEHISWSELTFPEWIEAEASIYP